MFGKKACVLPRVYHWLFCIGPLLLEEQKNQNCHLQLGLFFFPKSISEMLGFSFRSLPRGARFERSLRVTGAGAAEMAWEEATEGERGVSGR